MTRIESIKARLAAATPQDWNALVKNGVWRGTVIDLLMEAPQDLRDLLELADAMVGIRFSPKEEWRSPHYVCHTQRDKAERINAILSTLDSPVGDEGAER